MENKKESSSFDVKRYISKYKTNRKWVILSITLTMLIALAYLLITKPVYRTNANVILREDNKSLSPGNIAKGALMQSLGSSFGLKGGSINLNDEILIIASHSLLQDVVNELKLNTVYKNGALFWKNSFYKDSPIEIIPIERAMQDTLSKSIRMNFKIDKNGRVSTKATIKRLIFFEKTIGTLNKTMLPAMINTAYGSFLIKPTDFFDPKEHSSLKAVVLNSSHAAELLAEKIDIEIVNRKANAVALTTNDTNPIRSKEIIESILQHYDKDVVDEKKAQIDHTVKFVQERIDAIKFELLEAEIKVEEYKKTNNISDLEVELLVMLEQNGSFKEKLIETETQLNIINMVDEYVHKEENRYNLIPGIMGLSVDNPGLVTAITEYNMILTERARLLRNSNENNPMLINLDHRIDPMREGVFSSINSLKMSLNIAKDDLKKQEREFLGRIKKLPTQEREFVNIKRDQLTKEELFLFLLEKREENTLNLGLTIPKSKLVDEPYKEAIPVAPKAKIVLLIALFAGLIFPLFFFLYLDYIGKRVTGKENIKDLTNIPILSAIDLSDDNSARENEIQNRNTSLLSIKLNKILTTSPIPVIGITSGQNDEGKTSLAIKLAQKYAAMNEKTIVIDINYTQPTLQNIFGAKYDAGRLEQYLQPNSMQRPVEIINQTQQAPHLSYVTIKPDADISNYLNNKRTKELFNYLKENHSRIILKMPPLSLGETTIYAIANQLNILLYICKDNHSLKADVVHLNNMVEEQLLSEVQIIVNSKENLA